MAERGLSVLGEIFDRVWTEGGSRVTDVQTTRVPAGGSSVVDFKVEVPGTYILVNQKDSAALISTVLNGLSGPITVNGQTYNGVMPSLANLTDHEIADVLTYVQSHFGNNGPAVADAEVAKLRASLPKPESGHP